MAALNLAKLGETKVTVPLILIAAVALIGFKAQSFTVEVLDEFFFTDAAAAELADAVQANTEVLYSYIQKQEIRDVNEQIVLVANQIQETQLWIAANGQNPIATARLQDLVARQRLLDDKKDCLLNENISDKDVCEDA
jgi:hypothetical protein